MVKQERYYPFSGITGRSKQVTIPYDIATSTWLLSQFKIGLTYLVTLCSLLV